MASDEMTNPNEKAEGAVSQRGGVKLSALIAALHGDLIDRLRAAADEAQADHDDDVARIADMDGPIAAQVATEEHVEVVLSLTTVRRCIEALSVSPARPESGGDTLKMNQDPIDWKSRAGLIEQLRSGAYTQLQLEAADELERAEASLSVLGKVRGALEKASEDLKKQVPVTRAYLIHNDIDPNFADVLMSHYLDIAVRASEALYPLDQVEGDT